MDDIKDWSFDITQKNQPDVQTAEKVLEKHSFKQAISTTQVLNFHNVTYRL